MYFSEHFQDISVTRNKDIRLRQNSLFYHNCILKNIKFNGINKIGRWRSIFMVILSRIKLYFNTYMEGWVHDLLISGNVCIYK